MNAAFFDNERRLSVLDIMFESAADVAPEPEERQIFLREVLPMMINAGAKLCPFSQLRIYDDDEYQDFRLNWENLLTDPANEPNALRLFYDSIAEYDTESVRRITEIISPVKIVPDGLTPAEFFMHGNDLALRINDFPEAMSSPSARNAEIKCKLEKGAEILRILKEAGIEWPIVLPESTELTYIINEERNPRRYIDGMNPLCLCHSPEALKKVIASVKYETTDALKKIAESCESYYQPGEMMNILLDNGADIHALSDTWIGECISHRCYDVIVGLLGECERSAVSSVVRCEFAGLQLKKITSQIHCRKVINFECVLAS